MNSGIIDLETITKDVQQVLEHSEACCYPEFKSVEFNAKKIIDTWYKQKKRFIDKWGGLIYECDKITITLEPEVKEKKVFEFADKVQSYYLNNELSDFIFANKNNFFDNLTNQDYTAFDYSNSQYHKINKGSKIIKSFKYFETDTNKLRRIQDEASTLVQQDKITGTLCFSVHPLDFLSLSENNANWRSCHALDGDYRAGNLSYMLDEPTFICYIKSDEEQVLPRFPENIKWNSKKWRVLLYLDPKEEVLFAGRQYPFATLEGLKYVNKFIKTQKIIPKHVDSLMWFLDQQSKWSDWYNDQLAGEFNYKNNDITELDKHIIIKQRIYPLEEIVNDQSHLHFNDLLYSNKYIKPYYMFRYTYSNWKGKFKIGAQVPCLICGNRNLDLPHFLECYKCREDYGIYEED